MHHSESADAGLFAVSQLDQGAFTAAPTPARHQPARMRITGSVWSTWLADPRVRDRYHAKVYRPADPSACHFWLGAISDTGHGSFRAGSLPGRTRRGTVPAHLVGYQLAHGLIPHHHNGPCEPTICHRCDNHSCQNPAHLRLGTTAENRSEWLARRGAPASPLADTRGPAGRARAIAQAIREATANGESEAVIAERVSTVIDAGMPLTLW